MMRKIKVAFLTSIMLLIMFTTFNPTVAGKSEPTLIKRGKDYKIWQLNVTHFKWVSAPPWVWDANNNKYVPYIFEDNH